MSGLVYGSVCSGIEAASVAWHSLGWRPSFFSEIEAAPRAVLQHRHPEVPLHGDFTTIREGQYGAIDLLVGGTPCQSFSVAGLRGGLADDRGNLALQFLSLARRLRPRWLVWENVPGVLSSNGGRDFGSILGGMVELGYGFAYRVLDAQYVRVDGFGRAVPQRRRRVFVVGHLGDWRRPAAVLFERACLRGDTAPRREAGKRPAPTLSARPSGGGGLGTDFDCDGGLVARCLTRGSGGGQRYDAETETLISVAPTLEATAGRSRGAGTPIGLLTPAHFEIAHSLRAQPNPSHRADSDNYVGVPIAFDPTAGLDVRAYSDGTTPGLKVGSGVGIPWAPAIAFSCKDHGADASDEGAAPTLRAMGFDQSHANAGGQLAVACYDDPRRYTALHGGGNHGDLAPTLESTNPKQNLTQGWAVRRLTPRECERLQGFPDDYTLVPWRGGLLPDGPRYKALGNSMAVNCMRWIGLRIEMVDAAAPHLAEVA